MSLLTTAAPRDHVMKYVLNQSRLLRSFGVLLFLVGVVATSNGAEPVSFRAEIAPILMFGKTWLLTKQKW